MGAGWRRCEGEGDKATRARMMAERMMVRTRTSDCEDNAFTKAGVGEGVWKCVRKRPKLEILENSRLKI